MGRDMGLDCHVDVGVRGGEICFGFLPPTGDVSVFKDNSFMFALNGVGCGLKGRGAFIDFNEVSATVIAGKSLGWQAVRGRGSESNFGAAPQSCTGARRVLVARERGMFFTLTAGRLLLMPKPRCAPLEWPPPA